MNPNDSEPRPAVATVLVNETITVSMHCSHNPRSPEGLYNHFTSPKPPAGGRDAVLCGAGRY